MIRYIGKPVEKYHGKVFRIVNQLVKMNDGENVIFEYAERSPGVRILVTNEEKVLLTKEWRAELSDWDYRLPGGKVFESITDYLDFKNKCDLDINKQCLLAARRELKEETELNIELSAFTKFYISKAGATVNWDLHYFLVRIPIQDIKRKEIVTDEGEQTITYWKSFEEVEKLCIEEKIKEDRTVAVLLKYLLKINQY